MESRGGLVLWSEEGREWRLPSERVRRKAAVDESERWEERDERREWRIGVDELLINIFFSFFKDLLKSQESCWGFKAKMGR